VDNAVQANILAACAENPAARGQVYNVACGARTTLNELFGHIRDLVSRTRPAARSAQAVHRAERQGDVRHSLADISKARTLLGYDPLYSVHDGLTRAADWYIGSLGEQRTKAA
jgi:UDP-N-acetylglucosamine 4-epimerase